MRRRGSTARRDRPVVVACELRETGHRAEAAINIRDPPLVDRDTRNEHEEALRRRRDLVHVTRVAEFGNDITLAHDHTVDKTRPGHRPDDGQVGIGPERIGSYPLLANTARKFKKSGAALHRLYAEAARSGRGSRIRSRQKPARSRASE